MKSKKTNRLSKKISNNLNQYIKRRTKILRRSTEIVTVSEGFNQKLQDRIDEIEATNVK